MNTADLADATTTGQDLPRAKVKLKVTERAANEGRNPATGAPIQIAASRKPAFTPAKQLKDKLNAGS